MNGYWCEGDADLFWSLYSMICPPILRSKVLSALLSTQHNVQCNNRKYSTNIEDVNEWSTYCQWSNHSFPSVGSSSYSICPSFFPTTLLFSLCVLLVHLDLLSILKLWWTLNPSKETYFRPSYAVLDFLQIQYNAHIMNSFSGTGLTIANRHLGELLLWVHWLAYQFSRTLKGDQVKQV